MYQKKLSQYLYHELNKYKVDYVLFQPNMDEHVEGIVAFLMQVYKDLEFSKKNFT